MFVLHIVCLSLHHDTDRLKSPRRLPRCPDHRSRFCSGASKSVGFIRFDQRSEAETAISKLNGTIPKGKLEEATAGWASYLLGFTDPINVKFANTPNAAKSMIGLPLAPSYLPGISPSQQPVLTAVPSMRQSLNRYRYAAPSIDVRFGVFLANVVSLSLISFALFCIERHMNAPNIGKCPNMFCAVEKQTSAKAGRRFSLSVY